MQLLCTYLASGIPERRYIQTSCCSDHCRFNSGPAYDSSKCAGNFCCGNKAPTAKQLHHTSCLFSWGGFVNRACCSAVCLLGRPEATPGSWAILFARKGIYCDSNHGRLCFYQSPSRDKHRPLYSYQISLEVRGYCHRNADIIGIILSWGFTLFMTIHEFVLVVLHSGRIYSVYSRVNVILQIVTGASFIVVISWSYGYIYRETRRQIKRLKAEQLPQEEIQRIKKDRKAAITLAIILIALVITYLPAIVFGLLTTLPGSITSPPRFICVIWRWVGLAIMLGALFNPVIYCWRMKNLRRAFLEILHLREPENTRPHIERREIESHQPGPSTNQAFSLPTNGQPVLLSFRHLQSD